MLHLSSKQTLREERRSGFKKKRIAKRDFNIFQQRKPPLLLGDFLDIQSLFHENHFEIVASFVPTSSTWKAWRKISTAGPILHCKICLRVHLKSDLYKEGHTTGLPKNCPKQVHFGFTTLNFRGNKHILPCPTP